MDFYDGIEVAQRVYVNVEKNPLGAVRDVYRSSRPQIHEHLEDGGEDRYTPYLIGLLAIAHFYGEESLRGLKPSNFDMWLVYDLGRRGSRIEPSKPFKYFVTIAEYNGDLIGTNET